MNEKPYHHGNLKESLIEAGIDLIGEEGIGQLSLRKAASRCGVSQAAPYSHFQSKEDMLEAMREHVLNQFMAVLENVMSDSKDQNDPKLLIQIGKSYIMFFIRKPQYFTFLFSRHGMEINLSLDDERENNFPPFQLFQKAAVPILDTLGISGEKAEDSIISMWATVHGLASIATMENVHYRKNWEDKIEDIIWNK